MEKQQEQILGGCTLWARKTIYSDVFFFKPDKWFKIWFYIVSMANHEDKGKFKRGQCHLTYKQIIEDTKCDKNELQGCIRFLKKCQMLSTRKSTRGFIVTVLNYNTYQTLDNYKNPQQNIQPIHSQSTCNPPFD